jgi:hypothetical protein
MKISASQDELYTRCKRAWWLSYPHRMPSIAKGDLDFGSVIHNVCERYLLADDTGRVPLPPEGEGQVGPHLVVWVDGPLAGQPAGRPVDLYPAGWDSVTDKKGKRTIAPISADLIKRLVAKAIDEGILERRPDRQVEKWFERELISGVMMVGKIDMLLPGEVQDHKSTKAMKWAKSEKPDSPNYLGKSLQMLDYAHEALVVDPNLEVVRLRHNVFCKDPTQPIVRKVDVTVTRAEVMANWQRLMKLAWEMQVLDHQELPEDQWAEVQGPSEPDACEAFGGCPFVRICAGVDTPAQYKKRTDKQIKNKKNIQETFTWADTWGKLESPELENNDMNIFDKSKARQKARKAGKPADTAPAPETKPIDGSVATIAADDQVRETEPWQSNAPPWAQPNCPACKGKGFNKKGSPCRICDSTSKKAGGRTSLEYHLDSDEGNVIWEAKDGSGGGSLPIADETVEAKAQEKMELPAAPLDTPDAAVDEAPQKNIMAAVHVAGNEAAAEAAEDVDKATAKKGEKVLPEPKPAKPKKPSTPRKPRRKPEVAKAAEEVEPDETNTDPEDVSTAEEVIAAPTMPRSKGRPKRGFYLYIDCMPIGVETISVEGLFADMAAELAKEMNVESYFDLDVFKRRETFARVLTAEILQERYNRMHIVARNPQGAPDLRAFVDALISVAAKGRVIQGVR